MGSNVSQPLLLRLKLLIKKLKFLESHITVNTLWGEHELGIVLTAGVFIQLFPLS